MSNFWQRLLTGIVFVIVLIGAVIWNKYSFISLCFVITVLSIREYAVLFKGRDYKPNVLATIMGGTMLAAVWSIINAFNIASTHLQTDIKIIVAWSILAPFVFELFPIKNFSLTNALISLVGIVYITLGVGCFESLGSLGLCNNTTSAGPYDSRLIIGFLLLLWSSDTFAYLSGRAFGRTPLAPKISPKKTWEGSIGGAICTIGISFILYKILGCIQLYQWIVLGLIILVFGTIGDLIESRFKRFLGIKDSGNILPGHGGMLDRFDSLLCAAPVSFAFLVLTS